MCLSTIKETYRGRGKTVIAYKQFRRDRIGNLDGRFLSTPSPWVVGVEKTAKTDFKIAHRWAFTGKRIEYRAGFHAYVNKPKSTANYIWARVRLRGVRTLGTQSRKLVYVARYCTILELLP